MKKISYLPGLFLVLLLSSITVKAQRGSDLKLSLDYHYGFTAGGFKKDIVDKSSPRGFGGDIMYSIDPKWSVGLAVGFQDYYEKYPRAIYDIDKTSQVNAVLTNSVQVMPFMAKGMFAPLARTSSPVQPYVTGGVGAAFVNFDQYLGQFVTRKNDVQFTARGGAGLMIPFNSYNTAGAKLGANFNYVPYNRYGYSDLNSWDLQGGIYFAFR